MHHQHESKGLASNDSQDSDCSVSPSPPHESKGLASNDSQDSDCSVSPSPPRAMQRTVAVSPSPHDSMFWWLSPSPATRWAESWGFHTRADLWGTRFSLWGSLRPWRKAWLGLTHQISVTRGCQVFGIPYICQSNTPPLLKGVPVPGIKTLHRWGTTGATGRDAKDVTLKREAAKFSGYPIYMQIITISV